MMRLGFLLLPLLAACAAALPPVDDLPPLPDPAADTCGAARHAGLIGQDATALEKVLILAQVRVIRPGDFVTEDFSPTRINFHIDAAERIARISCG